MSTLSICILAAGQGSRMGGGLPKVLQSVAGRPMLSWVVDAAQRLSPDTIVVVAGAQMALLRSALGDASSESLSWVSQDPPRGTADALRCGLGAVQDASQVLVLYGDVPLIQAESLSALIDATPPGGLGLLSMQPEDPCGFGRVIRNDSGLVTRIVEQADASDDELAIDEVFTGILCGSAALLSTLLAQVNNDNAQGEYYLPDVIPLCLATGGTVEAMCVDDALRFQGANTQSDLAILERVAQDTIAQALLDRGVRLMDPSRLDVRGGLHVGDGVSIDINVVCEGQVSLGDGVSIGPNVLLRDVMIEDGAQIKANSVIDGATVGSGVIVGPFAYLRPGTHLDQNSQAGSFVELKKVALGAGSKVSHLSYIGDATVGTGVNIGAGVITCNYDGRQKHHTVIGDGAFVGADSQLVAPITIGDGATVGAGSCITKPVDAGSLAVTRARQKSIVNWSKLSQKEQD